MSTPRRDTYGVPVFLGAWIGACSQAFGDRWPDYGWIWFLTAVVLLGVLVKACNRENSRDRT